MVTLATERQASYLRDLGIDARTDLDELPKEEASAWIEELKGYSTRVRLGAGVPLTVEHLSRLEARDDALAQPPTRSPAAGETEGRDPRPRGRRRPGCCSATNRGSRSSSRPL